MSYKWFLSVTSKSTAQPKFNTMTRYPVPPNHQTLQTEHTNRWLGSYQLKMAYQKSQEKANNQIPHMNVAAYLAQLLHPKPPYWSAPVYACCPVTPIHLEDRPPAFRFISPVEYPVPVIHTLTPMKWSCTMHQSPTGLKIGPIELATKWSSKSKKGGLCLPGHTDRVALGVVLQVQWHTWLHAAQG